MALAQVRPRSPSVDAIAHQPGVLQVEPFRATQANIRFGKKERASRLLDESRASNSAVRF